MGRAIEFCLLISRAPTQRNADEECTCEEPSGLHSMCFNAFFHRKYLENYCDLFCMAATV